MMGAKVFVTPLWQAFMRSNSCVKKQVVHMVTKDLGVLKQIMGVDKFAVTVGLLHDQDMQVLNQLFRKKSGATDILSFPYHSDVSLGILPEPDDPADFELGEILLGFPYLYSTRAEAIPLLQGTRNATVSKALRGKPGKQQRPVEDPHSEPDSGAHPDGVPQHGLSFDLAELQKIIVVLLTHGMCHLTGYDHQDSHSFLKMHAREKEVLKEYSLLHGSGAMLEPFTEAPPAE